MSENPGRSRTLAACRALPWTRRACTNSKCGALAVIEQRAVTRPGTRSLTWAQRCMFASGKCQMKKHGAIGTTEGVISRREATQRIGMDVPPEPDARTWRPQAESWRRCREIEGQFLSSPAVEPEAKEAALAETAAERVAGRLLRRLAERKRAEPVLDTAAMRMSTGAAEALAGTADTIPPETMAAVVAQATLAEFRVFRATG